MSHPDHLPKWPTEPAEILQAIEHQTDAIVDRKSEPNVYLTIFAGRQRYLRCLIPYLDRLLTLGLLTEVHLWDYTRNQSDSEYIQSIAAEKPVYKYMKPTKNMSAWNEYYEYYSQTRAYSYDDIFIKCDDDVVYIDVDNFKAYLSEVKYDGLYYPNIINNDVCAYIQSRNGVHNLMEQGDIYPNYGNDHLPLTGWANGWYKRYEKAAAVHGLFLSNPAAFHVKRSLIKWHGRISINMFAGRFGVIQQYFALFLKFGRSDDEAFMSYGLQLITGTSNYIVPSCNIVHFGFNPQNTSRLDSEYLESYYALAVRLGGGDAAAAATE